MEAPSHADWKQRLEIRAAELRYRILAQHAASRGVQFDEQPLHLELEQLDGARAAVLDDLQRLQHTEQDSVARAELTRMTGEIRARGQYIAMTARAAVHLAKSKVDRVLAKQPLEVEKARRMDAKNAKLAKDLEKLGIDGSAFLMDWESAQRVFNEGDEAIAKDYLASVQAFVKTQRKMYLDMLLKSAAGAFVRALARYAVLILWAFVVVVLIASKAVDTLAEAHWAQQHKIAVYLVATFVVWAVDRAYVSPRMERYLGRLKLASQMSRAADIFDIRYVVAYEQASADLVHQMTEDNPKPH